jgi:hypothetical protein
MTLPEDLKTEKKRRAKRREERHHARHAGLERRHDDLPRRR